MSQARSPFPDVSAFSGLRLALRERSPVLSYALGGASVAVAASLTSLISPFMSGTVMPLFFGAVMFTAWQGGFWPGLFSTALSIIVIDQFLYPLELFNVSEVLSMVLFAAVSLLISSLSAAQRHATRMLRRNQLELELRVTQRTEELFALSAQFRSLFEDAPIAYHEINRKGVVCRVNRAECELLGIAEKDLLGRSVWEFVAAEQRDISRTEVRLKLRGEKQLLPFTREYNRADGSRLVLEIHEKLICDHTGAITGIRSALLDITERLHAEEAIRTLNLQLEERVRQRTQELERSNEDLQQFAYSASHDLQEPLRMVTSYTRLLEKRYETSFDEDGREFLQYIVDGAERMTRMIKDLLAFSRASHAGLEPAVDFAMADVVQEALWNLQTAIEENDAVVEYNGLPRLFGRQRELTPVMQNLISNAIKYRSTARPQIRISAARGDGEWVFCLADNGLGFEQQHAEKVFGVFQRLHGRNYPGTGIGLAICKRIVERNGGRMWVISEPGLGSRFYFTLPGPTVSAPPSA